jgi:hypothetical protein
MGLDMRVLGKMITGTEKVLFITPTAISTRERGTMVRRKASEHSLGQMARNTKGNGSTICSMAKVQKHGPTEALLLETTPKGESKAKVYTNGLMELCTQEIGLTTYLKAKAFSLRKMVPDTKETSSMIRRTARAFKPGPTRANMMESGKMAGDMALEN